MVPAKAMAVPRDTRMAVVPREDHIPRDTKDLDPNLDRMAVPRAAPNLDLDHMMDTLEVAMEEMTVVDRNAERTVSSKATLQAFAIRDNVKFT